MYDAIVIGGRVAGASTAMLLARHGGRRVLLVDTSVASSLSGPVHVIQPSGVARLARWGLLERLRAAGARPVGTVRADFGGAVLDDGPHPAHGTDEALVVRPPVLESVLVNAAAEAGVEVRLGFTVTGLLTERHRVVGIRGVALDGRTVRERATLVVGADGADSFVARAAGAADLEVVPATTVHAHTYVQGLDVDGIEHYAREGMFVTAVRVTDDVTMLRLQVPAARWPALRDEGRGAFVDALADIPALSPRLAAATLVDPVHVTQVADGRVRRASGAGWALVGDARLHQDPITSQGVANAFADADLLVGAMDAGLDAALARYHDVREGETRPMFELTNALAHLEAPPPETQDLWSATSA